jgi:lysophospholipase L1-like esterase
VRDDLNRSPERIAQGLSKLVDIVRKDYAGVFTKYSQPKVLVIAPPPVGDVSQTPIKQFFANAQLKSQQLPAAINTEAQKNNYAVFDAGAVTEISGVDGIHLTAGDHLKLGLALAPMVRKLLAR